MKKVDIFTDGACSGNPGIGGWAAVLVYNGKMKEISGYDKQTTNNRMELFAVIMGLRALKEPCEVVVTTDSAYVADAFNKNWIDSLQKIIGVLQIRKKLKILICGVHCCLK